MEEGSVVAALDATVVSCHAQPLCEVWTGQKNARRAKGCEPWRSAEQGCRATSCVNYSQQN